MWQAAKFSFDPGKIKLFCSFHLTWGSNPKVGKVLSAPMGVSQSQRHLVFCCISPLVRNGIEVQNSSCLSSNFYAGSLVGVCSRILQAVTFSCLHGG